MHIELVGCTSAGKTTLTQKIVNVGKRHGIEVISGDDFVLGRLRLLWVKNEFFRRRALEVCSVFICLWYGQKYRPFIRFVFDVIHQAPGSMLYKISLARAVFRKVGIYEIIRRSNLVNQMVIVDNEGIVQAAHILFVHTNGSLKGDLSQFANLVPLPDMIAYLRTPEAILLERTLRRGHRRIESGSEQKVQRFIKQAAETFEKLQKMPQIADRLFVMDSETQTVTKLSSQNGQLIDQACDIMESGFIDTQSKNKSEGMTLEKQLDTRCLDLINRLLEQLSIRNVGYCHWKSNIDLEKSLESEIDLDFFVGQESIASMLQILAQLGFREAKIKFGPETPGVSHYYGLDDETGKLVHVHLFTILITGESFVKSHRLPFEKMILEHRSSMGPVQVVSKPAESVLFVLRTFIKYSSLPDMLRLVGKSEEIRKELRWLLDNGDIDQTLSLLKTYCPVVSESLFMSCVNAINEKHSFFKKALLARRVRRRLRSYAEYGYVGRLFAYARLVGVQVKRRLKGKIRNKGLKTGGAVIAIVGADATGKSTLVGETTRWLGKVFAVRNVHVGKPPPSWLTFPFSVVLPAARRLMPRFRRSHVQTRSHKEKLAQSGLKESSSMFYAIRALTLAWDRYRLLQKVYRAKAQGDLIVCDRYPSEQIGAMDSPRLKEKTGKKGLKASLFNTMARQEHRLYERMPAPDIVIKLHVSIETAKKRNSARVGGDRDNDDFLEVRHRYAHEWHKSGTKHIFKISTEVPKSESILNIKKAIWESL